MDPEDIFVPHGVPYNPRSTPVLQKEAPPPSNVEVLVSDVDELGIATVILYKPISEAHLQIPLKHTPNNTGLLMLDEFGSNSALLGTHLQPNMNVLSINGCDCSGMSVEEAMLLIDSTVGKLSIKAVHSQVLLWPTEENPNRSLVVPVATAIQEEKHNHNHDNNSSALVTTNTSPDNSSNSEPKKPTRITVVIQKSSKRSPVGLTVGNYGDPHAFPLIVKIDLDGLCANTPLKVGMRVWSVNGLRCYNKDDTTTKLKRAKGTCHIEAEQQHLELEDTSGTSQESTGSRSRVRGVVKSLTPKNWLPSFHRRVKSADMAFVPAETGEHA